MLEKEHEKQLKQRKQHLLLLDVYQEQDLNPELDYTNFHQSTRKQIDLGPDIGDKRYLITYNDPDDVEYQPYDNEIENQISASVPEEEESPLVRNPLNLFSLADDLGTPLSTNRDNNDNTNTHSAGYNWLFGDLRNRNQDNIDIYQNDENIDQNTEQIIGAQPSVQPMSASPHNPPQPISHIQVSNIESTTTTTSFDINQERMEEESEEEEVEESEEEEDDDDDDDEYENDDNDNDRVMKNKSNFKIDTKSKHFQSNFNQRQVPQTPPAAQLVHYNRLDRVRNQSYTDTGEEVHYPSQDDAMVYDEDDDYYIQ